MCTHDPLLVLVSPRSDVGPDVGFEATGVVNSKLPTVGIWARKTDEVSDL